MPGFGEAIGRTVVNPIVSVVDVDGVIRRIDVNDILVNRVHWNDVLEKIDINQVLERVDMDALLERVNVDAVVDRSNLKQILARSTTSICSNILDALRARVIRADEMVQAASRCYCFRKKGRWVLPPKPSTDKESREHYCDVPFPSNATALAIAVQGRDAGFFSRAVAFGVDWGIMFGVYTVAIIVIDLLVQVMLDDDLWHIPASVLPFLYYGWRFLYNFTSLWATRGRTTGKVMFGLLIVQYNGSRLNLWQIALRSVLMALPLLRILSSFLGLVREDRRNVIDVVVCTAVIYAWDARSFQEREKTLPDFERVESVKLGQSAVDIDV